MCYAVLSGRIATRFFYMGLNTFQGDAIGKKTYGIPISLQILLPPTLQQRERTTPQQLHQIDLMTVTGQNVLISPSYQTVWMRKRNALLLVFLHHHILDSLSALTLEQSASQMMIVCSISTVVPMVAFQVCTVTFIFFNSYTSDHRTPEDILLSV